MGANPKISVIMNCLDCERYLHAALASVRSQTFQDLEIIFWDNCSKDSSADIAQGYGPALRYFRGGETLPLGAARNLAISHARGEYIAFLDCDDLWRPAKLEKQAALLDANPGLGLVCTDTEISDGEKGIRRLFEQTAPGRGRVFDSLMRRQWISMSSAMARKSALDDIAAKAAALPGGNAGAWFDESLNVCEEADVFYRIAHDWECDYVDEPLTVWRVHGGNTTFRKFGQFAAETRQILAKHRALYPDYNLRHGATVEILERRADFQEAVSLWQNGEGAQARLKIAPHKGKGLKYKLFWLASFMPGAMFDILAKVYFSLPGWAR